MCEPVYKAGTGYEVRRIQIQPSGVSEKDAVSILVCVYFPLTLWVKISLTITPSEYVPAHPVLHHQKKITVSSKASKKFHGNLYRVEGIIPESTSKLSDFLYKPENRVTWDKSLKVYNMVQKIDSDTCICHTITQSFAMGSISPRDFIDLVYLKHYEGNMDIISSTSVDFPAYPQSSNYIRGYNHACGYICSPLQENPAYSKLVMFVQTEMRGKLAPSIIEATMPSNLVSFILNVQDGIKTHKIPSGRGYHHNGHSSLLKKK
ncbi:stAR-related lipid transfer protein 6 isoform X2 [Hippopotamus amphibius kiboko]|uniref:stAR-related lipid transfer protein 6 isoform X2 n=1 Tax=Hippopotamus amphibius kiboko TaxID=575201 RepID=UPI00259AD140|nr:stAR-related lipid transfer protein 6 isoform X2 [Hippopotamus amphibius kiboko]XP_057554219.1 stAR-related lipid transfer protein 6 isoform X2 [Hippopotamus amphibius kiboko]XP_057554220.1 stAR-related lipid transfer protein 6 isoform X2 [Hippopotamus amphibius kiboko]XP_057554221.1 stAR-related lipid transfer protein 6 isoform X2 [Hippopotamus amphibius kiboko]